METKETCKNCDGFGKMFEIVFGHKQGMSIPVNVNAFPCKECNGRGYNTVHTVIIKYPNAENVSRINSFWDAIFEERKKWSQASTTWEAALSKNRTDEERKHLDYCLKLMQEYEGLID